MYLLLVSCFLLITSSVSVPDNDDIESAVTKCLSKFNVTEKILEEKVSEMQMNEETENILCYLKCIHDEFGTIDKDGNVNVKDLAEDDSLSSSDKTEYIECLNKVPTIKTCKDMMPLVACYEKYDTGDSDSEEDDEKEE